MSAVGTLVFCSDCGNLLDAIAGSDRIECEMCGAVTKGILSAILIYAELKGNTKLKPLDPGSKIVTTQSAPAAFPSALRLKKSAVQTIAAEDLQTEAEIKQKCPECAREKMWFYTLQLRSADEGVRLSPCTVLYYY